LAFILLLLAGALFGAFYKPSPSALGSLDNAGEGFSSLPRYRRYPAGPMRPCPIFLATRILTKKKAAFFEFLFPTHCAGKQPHFAGT